MAGAMGGAAGLDIGSIVGQLAGGGVVMAIVGLIRSKMS